jgi:quinol monooxygenase YgiN
MHGLIGRMKAKPGQRDALAAAILEGSGAMPGCRSYVVAHDAADPDAIWITEVWDDAAAHEASLQLPAVRAAIARAMPLIADFGPSTTTVPVGGTGL